MHVTTRSWILTRPGPCVDACNPDCRFLHTAVGGLDSVVNGTTGGWQHIRVRVAAAAVARVRQASNDHETRFGTVSLRWQFDGKQQLTMELSVPVGATAEVHSPNVVAGRVLASVSEGEATVWPQPSGAVNATMGGWLHSVVANVHSEAVVANVGSGSYVFTARYKGV